MTADDDNLIGLLAALNFGDYVKLRNWALEPKIFCLKLQDGFSAKADVSNDTIVIGAANDDLHVSWVLFDGLALIRTVGPDPLVLRAIYPASNAEII